VRGEAGPEWLHEIKHDGYRLAHHDGERARLISRRGLDWAWRFPMIVAAIKALAVRSCILDGELIACDANGRADFQLLRWRRHDDPAILCAFDLIELDGRDFRDEPIEERKAELTRLLAKCQPLALVLNRVFDDPGPVVFDHACKLGCEGDCQQTARFAVCARPNARLAQGEKPGRAGGAAGGGRALAQNRTGATALAVTPEQRRGGYAGRDEAGGSGACQLSRR
jgi:hypothetical protein